ncbi:phospholipase D C-like isoform X2 [Panonychus citri]|uniref:phospholipase D C-like isoform X2 n=1 Tax=Panonychus citri TaxID=50023 RepID=UPI0023076D65|nr:phospholipase D C-like isoform X2 [Panonychus citri]
MRFVVINQSNDDYDFKIEKEAINMVEIAEEEKIKETERLLQSGSVKDFSKLKNFDDNHQQPIDQSINNISPIVPGSPCIPMLTSVPINGIVSNLPSSSSQPVVTNSITSPVSHQQQQQQQQLTSQPSAVSNTLSTPLPVQLPLSIHGSILPGPHQSPYPTTSINSVIVNNNNNNNTPSVINCSSTNNFICNNVTKSISQGSSLVVATPSASSSTSTSSSLPTPIPVNNFTTENDLRYNSKEIDLNNMNSTNDVNNVVISRRNSVPTSLATLQENFGILRPSQIKCDSSNNSIDNSIRHQHQHQQHHQHNQQQFIPKTRINPADFESSSSSPFDDALLRAIDDKQELNHVFQHY